MRALSAALDGCVRVRALSAILDGCVRVRTFSATLDGCVRVRALSAILDVCVGVITLSAILEVCEGGDYALGYFQLPCVHHMHDACARLFFIKLQIGNVNVKRFLFERVLSLDLELCVLSWEFVG